MKLKDFLQQMPDLQDVDNNPDLGELEVDILIQTTANGDVKVAPLDVVQDWNEHSIKIKTDYIDLRF